MSAFGPNRPADTGSASPRKAGFRLYRINAWLDENCGASGAEKSGVGAVSIRRRETVVPSEGLGPGDLRTKPISIVGTERQQTVHSHLSGVLALREHLRVTNRPPIPSSRCAARIDRRGFGAKLGRGTMERVDRCWLRLHDRRG
jgi:hypothetical protein